MSSMSESRTLLTSDDPGVKGRRDAALSLLKRGADRNKIIEATGFTSDELFVIEQAYYDSRQELSPRNMRIKQLDRLDALVDMAYSQIEMFGLADDKGNWGANIQGLLAVLREISEVATNQDVGDRIVRADRARLRRHVQADHHVITRGRLNATDNTRHCSTP